MSPRIGYLLPTRESVMEGRPAAAPLLALAERAEGLGYDSIWVGDSILARPRHEPLTLLSAVAARTRRAELGTAVLLPALRNPVVLAHGIATLDQISEGRFILGVGIASDVPNIRSEFTACGVPFEKRVGRMLEGLRLARELWTGQSVNWNGRWVMENATLGPTPHRPGGPPIWIGGMVRQSLERVGRLYDGWFPNSPDPGQWREQWAEIHRIAREAGRNPAALTGALCRDLHRIVRAQALHVREQLPGRQDGDRLQRIVERLQAHRRRRLTGRKTLAVRRHGKPRLPPRPA
jgi:probable F420-dependent oxidoreductase